MNVELRLFLKNKFLELRHYLLTGLTGVVLFQVLVIVMVASQNSDRQQEINNRQTLIQQIPQLETAYHQVVKGLLELAVSRPDRDFSKLLASQGISAKTTTP